MTLVALLRSRIILRPRMRPFPTFSTFRGSHTFRLQGKSYLSTSGEPIASPTSGEPITSPTSGEITSPTSGGHTHFTTLRAILGNIAAGPKGKSCYLSSKYVFGCYLFVTLLSHFIKNDARVELHPSTSANDDALRSALCQACFCFGAETIFWLTAFFDLFPVQPCFFNDYEDSRATLRDHACTEGNSSRSGFTYVCDPYAGMTLAIGIPKWGLPTYEKPPYTVILNP